MTDKFEVKVKETVSKIQDLTWDNLEVAEESKKEEPHMEGVFQDGDSPVRYVPDPQVDANVFPGLGSIAELMHQGIQAEMRRRVLSPISDQEPEIHEEQEESEITIDWREDTMRFYRDLICRGLGITPEDLAADERLTAYYQSVADVAIQEGLQLPTERIFEIARDVRTANTILDSEESTIEYMDEEPTTEYMDAYRAALNQNTTLNDFRGLRAAIRDLADSVMASFGTFFKACRLLFDVRVLCVWDEFVWKRERRNMVRGVDWARTDISRVEYRRMTEGAFEDLRTRGRTAVIQNHISDPGLACPPGVLDLGTLTEEEMERFRTEWNRNYSREFANMLALCTPSRSRLTGRQ